MLHILVHWNLISLPNKNQLNFSQSNGTNHNRSIMGTLTRVMLSLLGDSAAIMLLLGIGIGIGIVHGW